LLRHPAPKLPDNQRQACTLTQQLSLHLTLCSQLASQPARLIMCNTTMANLYGGLLSRELAEPGTSKADQLWPTSLMRCNACAYTWWCYVQAYAKASAVLLMATHGWQQPWQAMGPHQQRCWAGLPVCMDRRHQLRPRHQAHSSRIKHALTIHMRSIKRHVLHCSWVVLGPQPLVNWSPALKAYRQAGCVRCTGPPPHT
jgi:hypothetical protein